MAATRSALIMTMWMLAVVVPAACADDNDRYGELAGAADELGGAIAGTEVTVIASPSPCVVSESCPDTARVDLPERSNLSLDEIAAHRACRRSVTRLQIPATHSGTALA